METQVDSKHMTEPLEMRAVERIYRLQRAGCGESVEWILLGCARQRPGRRVDVASAVRRRRLRCGSRQNVTETAEWFERFPDGLLGIQERLT